MAYSTVQQSISQEQIWSKKEQRTTGENSKQEQTAGLKHCNSFRSQFGNTANSNSDDATRNVRCDVRHFAHTGSH